MNDGSVALGEPGSGGTESCEGPVQRVSTIPQAGLGIESGLSPRARKASKSLRSARFFRTSGESHVPAFGAGHFARGGGGRRSESDRISIGPRRILERIESSLSSEPAFSGVVSA